MNEPHNEIPKQPEAIGLKAAEHQALPPEKRILWHYGHHANDDEERVEWLDSMLIGITDRTYWDFTLGMRTNDRLKNVRGHNVPEYEKSLGNVQLLTPDSAFPLGEGKKILTQSLSMIHDPDNELGRHILKACKEKGIPDDKVDRVLEAIELYWGRLPANPSSFDKDEVLLLHGDPDPVGLANINFPKDLWKTQQIKKLQGDYYEIENKYKAMYEGTAMITGAGAIASGIIDFVDAHKSQTKRGFGRRSFLKGTVAFLGGAALLNTYQTKVTDDRIQAAHEARETKNSDKSDDAVTRFDATLKILQNVEPSRHLAFRTLVMRTKTEEALEKGDIGLSQDALAAIVEGSAHLWDRSFHEEMQNPDKRTLFIKNYFDEVLVPALNVAIDQTPGKINKDTAVQELKNYIASVDITKIKAPDYKRFPLSLLDEGIITPVASYKSSAILQALG